MRSLAFIFLIVSSAAPAQDKKPAPAAQKRPPASMLNAKEEDEPAAAQKTENAALCGDADKALATALAYAFEPAPDEIRAIAIEDLALLADPRAVDPLATLILDANPAVATAAVHALGTFTTPRATQVLENVIRHPRISPNVKELAIKALPFHRRQRARDFLASIAKNSAYPQNLQRAAADALAAFDLSQPPAPPKLGATP
ncbi:MAG: HEAT repeat domain-containing protein [Myxococcaceae bacterium]